MTTAMKLPGLYLSIVHINYPRRSHVHKELVVLRGELKKCRGYLYNVWSHFGIGGLSRKT